eukprot:309076-Rhodomonas_salina.3
MDPSGEREQIHAIRSEGMCKGTAVWAMRATKVRVFGLDGTQSAEVDVESGGRFKAGSNPCYRPTPLLRDVRVLISRLLVPGCVIGLQVLSHPLR